MSPRKSQSTDVEPAKRATADQPSEPDPQRRYHARRVKFRQAAAHFAGSMFLVRRPGAHAPGFMLSPAPQVFPRQGLANRLTQTQWMSYRLRAKTHSWSQSLRHCFQPSDRFDVLNEAAALLVDRFKKAKIDGHRELRYKKYIQWSILQHYEVVATPLLDITQSLRVACSFAQLRSSDPTCYVYVFWTTISN